MKPDERRFLAELQRRTAACDPDVWPIPYVRELLTELGIADKRAAYCCQKWERKGWYEYGVNILAGWLTESGKEQPV